AQFNFPSGIASDGAGNLYIADQQNFTIRKLVLASGAVTTLAGAAGMRGADDGFGAAARFTAPEGIASDGAGHLFITDSDEIRQVVIATGAVTTLAGSDQQGAMDGVGPNAQFTRPTGIVGDGAGQLYVADASTVRKVVVQTAAVTTIAGTAGTYGSADGVGA